jgi:hypothetical protein
MKTRFPGALACSTAVGTVPNRLRGATIDSLKFREGGKWRQAHKVLLSSFSSNARNRKFLGVFAIKGPRKSFGWALRKHLWQIQEFHAILRLAHRSQNASTESTQVPSRTKHLMDSL